MNKIITNAMNKTIINIINKITTKIMNKNSYNSHNHLLTLCSNFYFILFIIV